jgi:AcrR family transcriptional regulator
MSSTRGANIRLLEKLADKAIDAIVPDPARKQSKRNAAKDAPNKRMNVHSVNRPGASRPTMRQTASTPPATSRAGVRQAGSRSRGRPLSGDKRGRILDAALRTFAARGYHGTTVPEVAAAAGVATGTLYNYFVDKQQMVNVVYRDAKARLKSALLDGLGEPDLDDDDGAETWFKALWQRLSAFATSEPDAFRFLELQDHVEYLDAESRALELSVLAPLFLAGKRLHDRSGGPPVDIAIALLWGAFVGVVKAARLGYLPLDARKLEQAGAVAWRLIAPPPRSKKGH